MTESKENFFISLLFVMWYKKSLQVNMLVDLLIIVIDIFYIEFSFTAQPHLKIKPYYLVT